MIDFELPDVLKNAHGMRAAELVIDGLAVLSFNAGSKLWEVAYPRKRRHDLTITIQELDGADQKVGKPSRHKIPDGIKSFNISLTDGSVAHYTQFPHGGPKTKPFNRKAPGNDPHDLSWMIDLAGDELQHGNVVLLPSDPSRRISLARIRHSLLCTLEPEDDDVKIAPLAANDPDAGRVLGPTNTEIVGVLLGNGPGDIRFEFVPAGLNNIGPLPYGANKRYRIEIINEDVRRHVKKKGFVRGDLRLLYKHVIDVSGTQKDLWARPARPGKAPFPDGDCHPPTHGGGSLEALLLEDPKRSTKRTSTKAGKKSTRGRSKKAAKKSSRQKATKAAKRSTGRKATKATKKSPARRATKAAKKSTKGKSKKALKRSRKGRSKRP